MEKIVVNIKSQDVIVPIDLEKKVDVVFVEKPNILVEFNGQQIGVATWISTSTQSILISRYLNKYFNSDADNNSVPECRYDFVDSENELKISIIALLTNVNLAGEADLVKMMTSGLFEKIISVVGNYAEFRANLFQSVKIIEKELELKESVGGVIGGVASKINELLTKLNGVSPEELKQLASESQELLKGLENSPVSAVFLESGKNKASKVQ